MRNVTKIPSLFPPYYFNDFKFRALKIYSPSPTDS